MGKNAKRRKEAKLQEKLKRSASGAGGCGHDGPCHHDHSHVASSVLPKLLPTVFTTDTQEAKR